VTAVYRELIPDGARVLDLMSSWRSHLPADKNYARVVGLGMNAAEMADNPQLDEFVVHDLNVEPRLPFADSAFDAVVVTVSIQYLTRPVEVFSDVNRILKPGGVYVLTYSNRCFPTKAIAAWLATNDQQHASIIATYFQRSCNWGEVYAQDRSPQVGVYSDPLFAVWVWKR
jgi:SAM-dependent methyltransferase